MLLEELKQNVPPWGWIPHFVQSCEKLTKNQKVLQILKKYKNPFVKATSLGKNSSKYTPKERLGIPSRKRDQGNVGERSNTESLSTPRPACSKLIFEQSFSCIEKRLGLSSSYKPSTSGSVCALYAL